MSDWRVETGSFGQGYAFRVARGRGDSQRDVWGYYLPGEEAVAESAAARANRECATEPTPEGLQYVMPGCEKDRSRGPAQGDLF